MTQKFDSLFSKYINFQPRATIPQNGIYRDNSGNFCVAVNGVKVATLNGGGGGGGDTVLANIPALIGQANPPADTVLLQGYHAANDGGGGVFVWNALSTATPDNGTIFAVTGIATGRYFRLYTDILYSEWFGTTGAGATDDTIALQNAINAAAHKTLVVSAGTYKVSLGGSAPGALGQNALKIANPMHLYVDPNATIILATMGALPVGWGTVASNVIGVLTVQSNDVYIDGNGTFDWNIANTGVGGYTSLIYVTTGNPSVGGPYYTNVHIDGPRIRNSRGAGIWTEDTSQLWVTHTDHKGGTGTDILVLRSLVNLFDVHVDDNYIDSSTIPPAVGTPIQLSINFTGSAGLATDRWSMCRNTIYAGLNTNVYYTATQIFSPMAGGLDDSAAWRSGHADGNTIEGAIGGGGPLGGAEGISAINVSDSTIVGNSIKNCYIGIELGGFNCTLADNTIDGGGSYMQLGLLMDGTNYNHAVTGNTIRGFGVWDNYQGIPVRGTKCTFTGNTIECPFGSGVNGTGLILYVDGENAALGSDNNVIVGNKITLGGASIAFDFYDCSNVIASDNVIVIETPTFSPIRIQAPGTVSHATRDFISIHNNVIVGGALPLINQVASADWGTNISYQTSRIDNPQPAQLSTFAKTVNFNAVADTQIPIILPNGCTRYQVTGVRISGASASLTTSQVGLFTAAAGGGVPVVASGTAVTVATASDATNNNSQSLTVANSGTESYTAASLFFRVTTPQGSAATGTVTVTVQPMP